MLKIATKDDLPAIIRMVNKFVEAQPFDLEIDQGKVIALVNHLLNEGPNISLILLCYEDDKPVGMIAARKQELIYHKGVCAAELMWWVEPEYRKSTVGKQLMDAYEFWGRKVGCTVAQMSLLETDQAEQIEVFYKRKKYKRVERSYIKGL